MLNTEIAANILKAKTGDSLFKTDIKVLSPNNKMGIYKGNINNAKKRPDLDMDNVNALPNSPKKVKAGEPMNKDSTKTPI